MLAAVGAGFGDGPGLLVERAGSRRNGAGDAVEAWQNLSPSAGRGCFKMALRRHRRMERNLSVSRVLLCVCP